MIEYLREAGKFVEQGEKTFCLQHGLPPSWREWRDLQSIVIKFKKSEDLIAAIKTCESTINCDKAEGCGNNTILAVKRRGKGYRSTGSVGARQSGRQAGDESSMVCYYCQKKRHWHSKCWKLKLDRAKGICEDKITTAAQARSASEPKVFLFTAFSSTSTPAIGLQWLLDSGYSAQVTGTREWFMS